MISRHSEAAGLGDTIIVNTCAVTAEAEKQARQAVRRHRRDHPGARIVVTGCAAQIDPSSWQGMAEVDAVIGNHEKLDPATWTRLAGRNADETMVAVGDIMTVRETAPHLLEGLIHAPVLFCRFSKAVIIVAPSALFPMAVATTDRCRWR